MCSSAGVESLPLAHIFCSWEKNIKDGYCARVRDILSCHLYQISTSESQRGTDPPQITQSVFELILLLASTSSSNKNYTVLVTHKINFLLLAVKLLPEFTTVFFRLGRRNQTPQVFSFQSKIPRLSSEIFFFVLIF